MTTVFCIWSLGLKKIVVIINIQIGVMLDALGLVMKKSQVLRLQAAALSLADAT